MKKFILILFGVFIFQASCLADVQNNKKVTAIDSQNNGGCTLFTLEGVSEADPVNPGNSWFAIPVTNNVHDVIVSLLFNASSTKKTVTVHTTGNLTCGFAEVEQVVLSKSTYSVEIRPDMQVNNINLVSADGTDGLYLDFDYNVTNTGSGSAAASVAQVVLSTTVGLDINDCALGAVRPIPALAVGQSYNDTVTISMTASEIGAVCGYGNFYWGIIADFDNTVDEINETNNIGVAATGNAINVIAPPPDLQVSNTTLLSSNGANGLYLDFNYDVTNLGPGPAGASTARVVLSTDATLTTSDCVVGGASSIPALAVGQSQTSRVTINVSVSQLNTTCGYGNFYWGIIADFNNALDEINETNNIGMATAGNTINLVAPKSDLQADQAWVIRKDGENGLLLDFDYSVKNNGPGAAPASIARVVLSTDSTLTSSDCVIGGPVQIPALAVGQGYSGVASIRMTASQVEISCGFGGYQWGIIYDFDNILDETNENNNVGRDPEDGGIGLYES